MKSLVIFCLILCLAACTPVSSVIPTAESVNAVAETAVLPPTVPPSATATALPAATATASATPAPSLTPSPTDPPLPTHTPSPTPHPLAELPLRIVFASDRDDDNSDIFTMKADGAEWQRLTDDPAFDFTPQFSPDGQNIAFASDREGALQIYVMAADGSNLTRLTNNSGNDRDPSWSPDGSQIVFASDRHGEPDIFVINSDGSGEKQLTDNDAMDVAPVWSPDGQWLVYSSSPEGEDPDLYLMRPDGSDRRQITFSPNYDGDQAAWSPDSQSLIFPSSRIGNYELYTMSLDGSELGTLTRTERDEYSGLLSPDGRFLLINVYDETLVGLVVLDLATGEEFPLTDAAYHASFGSWAPDETAVYDPAVLAAAAKPDETCVYADDDTMATPPTIPSPTATARSLADPLTASLSTTSCV
jgi:Tol biopolymer transport system component